MFSHGFYTDCGGRVTEFRVGQQRRWGAPMSRATWQECPVLSKGKHVPWEVDWVQITQDLECRHQSFGFYSIGNGEPGNSWEEWRDPGEGSFLWQRCVRWLHSEDKLLRRIWNGVDGVASHWLKYRTRVAKGAKLFAWMKFLLVTLSHLRNWSSGAGLSKEAVWMGSEVLEVSGERTALSSCMYRRVL